jgi:hypothetical protein
MEKHGFSVNDRKPVRRGMNSLALDIILHPHLSPAH